MFFIVAACLLASASACCLPDQWEGDMGVVIGLFNEQSKNVIIVEGNIKISYDNVNKMASTYEKIYVDGKPNFRTTVVDYNKMAKYTIIDGENVCNKTMPEKWNQNCFAENNTQAEFTVGFGDNAVKVKNMHVFDPVTMAEYYMMVTADTCVPVSEVYLGHKDNMNMFETIGYSNMRAGISDRRVFNIPTACDQSNAPVAASNTRRSSYFF